jgi:hypothetical protein
MDEGIRLFNSHQSRVQSSKGTCIPQENFKFETAPSLEHLTIGNHMKAGQAGPEVAKLQKNLETIFSKWGPDAQPFVKELRNEMNHEWYGPATQNMVSQLVNHYGLVLPDARTNNGSHLDLDALERIKLFANPPLKEEPVSKPRERSIPVSAPGPVLGVQTFSA